MQFLTLLTQLAAATAVHALTVTPVSVAAGPTTANSIAAVPTTTTAPVALVTTSSAVSVVSAVSVSTVSGPLSLSLPVCSSPNSLLLRHPQKKNPFCCIIPYELGGIKYVVSSFTTVCATAGTFYYLDVCYTATAASQTVTVTNCPCTLTVCHP